MKKLFPMLLLCLTLWSTSAMASTVIVTADSNIGYSENATFFSNVFGNQSVLASFGTNADWMLNNHMNMVSPVVSHLFTVNGDLTSSLLSNYDWLMLSGSNFLNDFERADVVDYVLGGGNLWLVGEYGYDYLNDYIAEMNNTLAALGSSILATVDGISTWGDTTTQAIATDPLTAGLDSFRLSASGILTGGTALVYANDYTVVAYETFGNAPTVPEPSTFALAALGLLGLVGLRRRMRG